MIAACKPGYAICFLGSTAHGAGANVTGSVRRGLVIGYSLGWLKPYENPWLAYPPSVARSFPKMARFRARRGLPWHRLTATELRDIIELNLIPPRFAIATGRSRQGDALPAPGEGRTGSRRASTWASGRACRLAAAKAAPGDRFTWHAGLAWQPWRERPKSNERPH
ncbi:hypothetical protein [Sphingopyxis sp.]|uniref:hypothetical protein n=1 Tax=Sphingopyxis sp. TaxID=1908224 RepID=UPI00344E82F7|nr:hypothetical protein [Sphingopyxis sp.]